MKKYIIAFLIGINSFAIGFVNEKFNSSVTEISQNGEKRYNIQYDPNGDIKIEVTFPEINKGEIYTYKNGKKYIYYPKLKQTVEQSLVNQDSDIIAILQNMKKITKTQTINDKKYIVDNGNVVKILAKDYEIIFKYNGNKKPVYTIFKGKNQKVEYTWKY